MDPTAYSGLLEQLGTAGLAGLAIILLFQSFKDKQGLIEKSEAAAERYAVNERADKLLVLAAFDKSTETRAIISSKMDSLLQLVAKQGESIDALKTAKS